MISVVMSVYNAEIYLDEAIQSILNQTYKDFEFIIIDDGSTDKSLEIIGKYKNQDERIVAISRENRGLITSLNEGIEKARGQYIARMDADDISLPKRFEEQIKLMESENIDICGGHYFIINENNTFIDCFIAPLEEKSILNFLCYTPPFGHPTVIIKKEFMINNNLLYGTTKYKIAEDYALWIEFWNKNAKFGNANVFLLKYRDFNNSLSKKNKIDIFNETSKISKQFILQNKDVLHENLKLLDINTMTKREQEIVVLILCELVYSDFQIKYIKTLKTINKRTLVCGILKFFSNKIR